jgi:hypothetical protein
MITLVETLAETQEEKEEAEVLNTEQKRNLSTIDKKRFMKVLAASMLADGYLEKNKAGKGKDNARYSIKQKAIHKDYLDYLSSVLIQLTRLHRYDIPAAEYKIQGKMCSVQDSIQLRTMRHPWYTTMHARMYLNGIKRIDPHYLTLLDPEFLAIWYQEDGFITLPKDSKNPTPLITFCTESFTYGDQILARKMIIERTGFIFNVVKRGKNKAGEMVYRMTLARKQTQDFLDYVKPFIVPSFEYKLKPANVLSKRHDPSKVG